MSCLKCGKKTTDEQGFCRRCLEVMERYPVNADVHVQLPNRPAAVEVKKTQRKRRVLSPEEQIPVLRKRVRKLALTVVVLAVLLGAAAFLLIKGYLTEEELEIGKNYTFGYPFG